MVMDYGYGFAYLSDNVSGIVRVIRVGAKSIQQLPEEKEENWQSSTMDDGTEGPHDHQEIINRICEREQLVKWH